MTKAIPPDLIARAVPGDRLGVARAYGNAASWLRADRAPPRELCAWLAERLAAVAAVLSDDREKKPADAVLRALGASSSKRGRREADNTDRDRFLAWDVFYALKMSKQKGQAMADMFALVAERCSYGKHQVSPAVVEAAWKRRREFGIQYRK